ncbi:collagen alpha-5(IV) chain-like, partial [Daubentonia madagascariensis]
NASEQKELEPSQVCSPFLGAWVRFAEEET